MAEGFKPYEPHRFILGKPLNWLETVFEIQILTCRFVTKKVILSLYSIKVCLLAD